MGDKITMIIPQAQTTALGVIPKIKMLKVSSIFHYDMSQYDNNYVFININDARKLFLSKKQVWQKPCLKMVLEAWQFKHSVRTKSILTFWSKNWLSSTKSFSKLRKYRILASSFCLYVSYLDSNDLPYTPVFPNTTSTSA